jgi:hypothetical protein
MRTYCIYCLSTNEAKASDKMIICSECHAGYIWPTSGYSFNIPSVNKSAAKPNKLGSYPNCNSGKQKSANIPAVSK